MRDLSDDYVDEMAGGKSMCSCWRSCDDWTASGHVHPFRQPVPLVQIFGVAETWELKLDLGDASDGSCYPSSWVSAYAESKKRKFLTARHSERCKMARALRGPRKFTIKWGMFIALLAGNPVRVAV